MNTESKSSARPPAIFRERVVAGHREADSRLPDLLQVPVAGRPPLALAASVAWPRGKDACCHVREAWQAFEGLRGVRAVRRRRGAAVDVVLGRRRARCPLFVPARGRRRTRDDGRGECGVEEPKPPVGGEGRP